MDLRARNKPTRQTAHPGQEQLGDGNYGPFPEMAPTRAPTRVDTLSFKPAEIDEQRIISTVRDSFPLMHEDVLWCSLRRSTNRREPLNQSTLTKRVLARWENGGRLKRGPLIAPNYQRSRKSGVPQSQLCAQSMSARPRPTWTSGSSVRPQQKKCLTSMKSPAGITQGRSREMLQIDTGRASLVKLSPPNSRSITLHYNHSTVRTQN